MPIDAKSVRRLEKLIDPYRVTNGKKFRLADIDPADTGGFKDKDRDDAKALLQQGVEWLAAEQDTLYAADHWSVLLVFQAMDAAGKDGTIKHVMSGVNPQGCQVTSFKQPSVEELDHDFLWRCSRNLPERGRIGIFNRSYYEEVLVLRVHPELLRNERLPGAVLSKKLWEQRFEDIAQFESYLARQGTLILKFFLHVSKREQKRRFLARLDTPSKNWKFSAGDVAERAHWDDYQAAYEDVIRHTSAKHAPWYVVPADNKWFTRMVVSSAIVHALHGLDLRYPDVDPAKKKELAAARRRLMTETD